MNETPDPQKKPDQYKHETRRLNREIAQLKTALAQEKIAYATILNQQKADAFIRHRHEKCLSLLLANSPSIILLLNPKLQIEFCTKYFIEKAGLKNTINIFEHTLPEILSSFQDAASLEKLLEQIQNAIKINAPSFCDVTFYFNEDGSAEDFSGVLVPMTDEHQQNNGLILMFHDVTDLKRSSENALASNRAKSSFLSKMSHEIRTPMNAIIGMTKLIMQEDISSSVREMATTIQHSGNHMLSVINGILDFSKIESGQIEVANEEYLFHSVINDVVNIINTHNNNPKVTFTAYMEHNVPNYMYGDSVRLQQILLNILSNAVKYTFEGYVTMDISWQKTGDDTLQLIIQVEDTGIGIKPENMKTLFDEFAQFDLEKTRNIEGTGLGLAITRNLVKLMGGEIKVKSTYGVGSTFTVLLPQKYKESTLSKNFIWETESESKKNNVLVTGRTRIDTVKEYEEEIHFIAPSVKILVVDDIDINLQVAVGMLEPYGIQTDVCLNGKEAIGAIKSNDYDLIFMDHMMPEMNGVEAVAIIRGMDKKYSDLPIIALTANAIVGAREMFLENGFNDFLSKPIETGKLNNVLARWIPSEKWELVNKDVYASWEEEPFVSISIDDVDIADGVSHSGGSIKSYLNILAVFCKDGRAKIDELANCLKSGNLPLYTTYVHALKSACANIGANKHSEEANALEAAGLKQDLSFIEKHNSVFVANLKKLLDDVEAAVLAHSPKFEDDKTLDRDVLNKHLSKLKSALESFDAAAINETSEILQDFTQFSSVDEALSNILQNTLIGNYKEAVLRIEEMLLE